MKSYAVHYRNKYPGAIVFHDENSLNVHKDGELIVAIRKNGAGGVYDAQVECGARDAHDLSMIPRDTRCFKLSKGGAIVKDEEFDKRKTLCKKFQDESGKVLSCEELKDKFRFDEKGNVFQSESESVAELRKEVEGLKKSGASKSAKKSK